MTKPHKTVTALLLAAALLLSGCEEQRNSPAQGTENTSSDSSVHIDQEDSASENESTDESQSSADSDSENSASGSDQLTVPTEFTEEDRNLQAILNDIQGGVNLIQNWYSSGAALSSDGLPLTPEQKFLFPQSNSPDNVYSYYLIPDGYSIEGGTIMPTTRADMIKIMLDYYSEKYIDQYYDIGTGTMEENSNGTFSVVFDESRNTHPGHFIEINKRLYRFDSEGGNVPPLNVQAARVTHKTDDLIEFTFVDYQYGVGNPLYKYRASGILKYERGGWKLDQLKYDN